MKYVLLIIFLNISSSAFSQLDTCKWLKDQAVWYYTPWQITDCGQKKIIKVEIIGDTTIGNRICSVLGVIEEDELVKGSELVIFYEASSAHVYFYEEEQFKMLYDFSFDYEIGDTIEFYLPQNFGFYDISSSQGGFTPSKIPYKLEIRNLSNINLEDTFLRTIETIGISPNEENGEDCFDMRTIIQGIGCTEGILGRACLQLTGGCPFGEYLRCFTSDALEYMESEEACDPTTAIVEFNNLITINIDIYPNPVSNVLTIYTDHKFKELMISSASGIKFIENNFESSVNVSNLPSGLFILTLRDEKGNTYTHTFLKE